MCTLHIIFAFKKREISLDTYLQKNRPQGFPLRRETWELKKRSRKETCFTVDYFYSVSCLICVGTTQSNKYNIKNESFLLVSLQIVFGKCHQDTVAFQGPIIIITKVLIGRTLIAMVSHKIVPFYRFSLIKSVTSLTGKHMNFNSDIRKLLHKNYAIFYLGSINQNFQLMRI